MEMKWKWSCGQRRRKGIAMGRRKDDVLRNVSVTVEAEAGVYTRKPSASSSLPLSHRFMGPAFGWGDSVRAILRTVNREGCSVDGETGTRPLWWRAA
jgi:hypothetical protein